MRESPRERQEPQLPERSTAAGADARSSSRRSRAPRASRRTRSSSRHCQGGRSMLARNPHASGRVLRRQRCRVRRAARAARVSGRPWRARGGHGDAPASASRRGRRCARRPRPRGWKPEMQPRSVDFPAPFGPIRQVREPDAMASETSSTALTAPKDLVTPASAHARSSRDVVYANSGARRHSDSGYLILGVDWYSLGKPPPRLRTACDHLPERLAIFFGEAAQHRVSRTPRRSPRTLRARGDPWR